MEIQKKIALLSFSWGQMQKWTCLYKPDGNVKRSLDVICSLFDSFIVTSLQLNLLSSTLI